MRNQNTVVAGHMPNSGSFTWRAIRRETVSNLVTYIYITPCVSSLCWSVNKGLLLEADGVTVCEHPLVGYAGGKWQGESCLVESDVQKHQMMDQWCSCSHLYTALFIPELRVLTSLPVMWSYCYWRCWITEMLGILCTFSCSSMNFLSSHLYWLRRQSNISSQSSHFSCP